MSCPANYGKGNPITAAAAAPAPPPETPQGTCPANYGRDSPILKDATAPGAEAGLEMLGVQGLRLNPLGIFVHTSIQYTWSILSGFLTSWTPG
jgi:hypothetical protein